MRTKTLCILATALAGLAASSNAQQSTFQTRSLTPETALVAAQAAMEACRKQGYQVGVAVVDRAGLLQVFLRDRFAGPHTVEVASNKAWTLALVSETQAGRPMSGIRSVPRMLAVGGGLMIEGGGAILGAIGVSGAPGGEADDVCASAGIKAIADAVEF